MVRQATIDYGLLIQVPLPDNPSWDHLGELQLSVWAECCKCCVSHHHEAESLAILAILFWEKSGGMYDKYHARLSHKMGKILEFF